MDCSILEGSDPGHSGLGEGDGPLVSGLCLQPFFPVTGQRPPRTKCPILQEPRPLALCAQRWLPSQGFSELVTSDLGETWAAVCFLERWMSLAQSPRRI
jgi:hypothetical protein